MPKHVNFGLAVDMERSGQRILIVPNIKAADEFDFSGFWNATRSSSTRSGPTRSSLRTTAGTTMTLTNPGTVGTTQSVPRLVKDQGLIVGTGAISYPGEFEASDPKMIARIGVAKLITVTSTYDHRVIQGAESGQFLALIHDLLQGANRFYDEIFASLKIPYEPVRWSRDFAAFDDCRRDTREAKPRDPAHQHVPSARAPARRTQSDRLGGAASPGARPQPLRT